MSKTPETIQLSDNERLELENLRLKMVLAEQEHSRLRQRQAELGKTIEARLEIDSLANYLLNVEQGVGKRTKAKECEVANGN